MLDLSPDWSPQATDMEVPHFSELEFQLFVAQERRLHVLGTLTMTIQPGYQKIRNVRPIDRAHLLRSVRTQQC
jgi:hypothetical protein